MRQSKNYVTLTLKEIVSIPNFDRNRAIVISHAKQIEKSLLEDSSQFIQAMIISKLPDGSYMFVDGHHRKEACKKIFEKDNNAKDNKGNSIELDARVIEAKEPKDVISIIEKINNTQLRWNPMDFIKFNAFRGNESCTMFLNFYEKNEACEVISSSIGKCFAVLGHYKPKKSDKESIERFPIISRYHIDDANRFLEFYNNLISAMSGIMIYIIGPCNLGIIWNFRRAFFDGNIDNEFIEKVESIKLSEYDLRRGIKYLCAKNTEGYYRETVEGFIDLVNRKAETEEI